MDDYFESLGIPAEAAEARRLVATCSDVMQVRTARWVDQELGDLVGRPMPSGDPALELRGRLLVDSDRAFDWLSERLATLGYVAMLREDKADHVVIALPGSLPKSGGRTLTALALFGATLLSVLWVGAEYDSVPGKGFNLLAGVPFAASLLGILLAHEMGHYLMARWQRIPATLPYFIPMPLSLLGTMGAVIQTRAPSRNRRALLLLGASGPIAGLVVAIPVLFVGLSSSELGRITPGTFQEGNSILYALAKLAVFGRFLPSAGVDVYINSVALAGWAGLLVTGMNLIPAGQLDGGHIAYALFGRRAKYLTWGVVGALVALSLAWQGWMLWAFLVLFMGRVHAVPLDDVTPLRPGERLLAALSLVLLLLVFIPVPMVFN
ncbi:MAG: site-2 protease family protein [Sphingomonadaceae bacterium]